MVVFRLIDRGGTAVQSMSDFLSENPLYCFWIAASIAMTIGAIYTVMISQKFKRKWIWCLISIYFPLLILVFYSDKFKAKWAWSALVLIGGLGQLYFGNVHIVQLPLHIFKAPISIYFGESVSVGALIVTCFWLFWPQSRAD